jgi:hypothetical protein
MKKLNSSFCFAIYSAFVLAFIICAISCSKNDENPEPEEIIKKASDYVEIGKEYMTGNRLIPIKFLTEEYSMSIISITDNNKYDQEFSFSGGTGSSIYSMSFGTPVTIKVNYKFSKSGNSYAFYFKSLNINYTTSNSIVFKSYTVDLEFNISGKLLKESKQNVYTN